MAAELHSEIGENSEYSGLLKRVKKFPELH